MEPQISVIVPVYNTEQYLPRCIDSILGQSFADFELLLVNDGSTDRSGAVCNAYAEKDSRIRVFHKENGGVSSARNMGLDNARGEWITFVDSDDELLPDGLQTMLDGVTPDSGMVMCGFVEYDTNGAVLEYERDEKVYNLSKSESVLWLYNGLGEVYFYFGYPFARLFRRSHIEACSLRFDTFIAIKEDTLFVMQYICRSKGHTRMNAKPVYRYNHREGSAMSEVKKGFNRKDVDSFRAFVAMKHEAEKCFPWYSDVMLVAKHGILNKYYSLVGAMDREGVDDMELRGYLANATKTEVGSIILFKIEKKLFKLKRKSCKRLNKQ